MSKNTDHSSVQCGVYPTGNGWFAVSLPCTPSLGLAPPSAPGSKRIDPGTRFVTIRVFCSGKQLVQGSEFVLGGRAAGSGFGS
eukprot:674692-Rhodomonas_salina.2